jgi:hypothetical protein
VALTTEQAAHLLASKRDKKYWMRNFYHIPVIGKGAQLFDLRNYQEHVLDTIDTYDMNIGLKARQIGWTTVSVAYALNDCLFNQEHPWLFVSRTEDAAVKMLDKAKYAYVRMPAWMKESLPRIISETQTTLIFDNGSRIESVPATGSTGRGDSVYGALLDEAAFMEYAEGIWGAIEPLVYGKAMVFSTANGMGNFFHDVWLDSQMGDSAWHGTFFPWDVVPDRDQEWYDRTKLLYRNREWLFYQEYPQSPEEAFAKSGRVAFPYDLVVANYFPIEPAARLEWIVGSEPRTLQPEEDADIVINIWHEPEIMRNEFGQMIKKPNYVIASDIAEGLEHGDYTYVTVMDAHTGVQMASSKSGIHVAYLDELLEWLGYYYHTALQIPERNNAGIMPVELLSRKRRYPRIYRQDTFAERLSSYNRTPKLGWTTSRTTKPKMVNDFILALTNEEVTLHDPEFVQEAQTFVADGKGSFGATVGNHDDVIMGTLICWQGVLDAPDYPPVYFDNEIRPITHDDIDSIGFDYVDYTESMIYNPIGRQPQEKSRKTFILTSQNFE